MGLIAIWLEVLCYSAGFTCEWKNASCSNETVQQGLRLPYCQGVFTLYEGHTLLSLEKALATRVTEEAASLVGKQVGAFEPNEPV